MIVGYLILIGKEAKGSSHDLRYNRRIFVERLRKTTEKPHSG
jgi:hypothetical protein